MFLPCSSPKEFWNCLQDVWPERRWWSGHGRVWAGELDGGLTQCCYVLIVPAALLQDLLWYYMILYFVVTATLHLFLLCSAFVTWFLLFFIKKDIIFHWARITLNLFPTILSQRYHCKVSLVKCLLLVSEDFDFTFSCGFYWIYYFCLHIITRTNLLLRGICQFISM